MTKENVSKNTVEETQTHEDVTSNDEVTVVVELDEPKSKKGLLEKSQEFMAKNRPIMVKGLKLVGAAAVAYVVVKVVKGFMGSTEPYEENDEYIEGDFNVADAGEE